MRIELLRCWFKNVLPFGNVEQQIEFKNGVYKITGVNKDKGGSNGAGKTSIMNVISFIFYGKPFDPSIDDIQNYTNNAKKTPAVMGGEFKRGNELYQIVRTKSGNSNSVTFSKFENDSWQDITLGKGITATNAMIVDTIGISFEMFCLTCIFSGNVQPFLMRSAAEQRGIIETLFDVSELSEYAELAKAKKSEIETEVKIQEALQKSVDDQIKALASKINDARTKSENWEREKKLKLQTFDQLQQQQVDYQGQRDVFRDIDEINTALVEIRHNKQQLTATKQQFQSNQSKAKRPIFKRDL